MLEIKSTILLKMKTIVFRTKALILGSAVLLNTAGDLAGQASANTNQNQAGSDRSNSIPRAVLGSLAPGQKEGIIVKLTPAEEAEYWEKVGLQQSEELGVTWFNMHQYAGAFAPLRHAATMGRAKAQYHLGNMYRSELGIPKSDTDASIDVCKI